MSVEQAHQYGIQMYHEGMDLNNIPEHFSAVEREVCIESYEQISSTYSLDELDNDIDLNQIIDDEDNYKELDFNA